MASLELFLETEFSEIKTAHHPNQIISITKLPLNGVDYFRYRYRQESNNGNRGLYWLKRIREIAHHCRSHAYSTCGDVRRQ